MKRLGNTDNLKLKINLGIMQLNLLLENIYIVREKYF